MVRSASPPAPHLALVSDDRRDRAREKKRRKFLDAAGRVIDEVGLHGITIKRVAEEADAAVGSIYTYFPSKAALVAALQAQAVDTLRASLANAQPQWDAYLGSEALDDRLAVLVRLEGFASFLAAASVVFADEFSLQRQLLSDRVDLSSRDETAAALAIVHRMLEPARVLLEAAAELDVIEPHDSEERTVLWVTALNGVLLVDNLSSLDRHLFRAPHLARLLTFDLLTGWGADRADVEVAASHVDKLAALGPMAPPPEGPGYE
ncbi:MAG: TetR/AcrR family transcriptional regulator [Actinobacteria bacterium]|nr:TetR/AcrR family transcriptional regulator [Actinomycetota bacterium]